ncbi:hypothetical protein L218DRAFT_731535 [Marasmius fiardii PR-910]|nr:hypothetical protein L218DRAFT_731535 [Marasmius fiardii PR-910]
MYCDGVVFYVLTFLVSMANVIIIISLPELSLLLYNFSRVLHSLLTSRAILRIRQLAWQRRNIDQTISGIRFTRNEHAGDVSHLQSE